MLVLWLHTLPEVIELWGHGLFVVCYLPLDFGSGGLFFGLKKNRPWAFLLYSLGMRGGDGAGSFKNIQMGCI